MADGVMVYVAGSPTDSMLSLITHRPVLDQQRFGRATAVEAAKAACAAAKAESNRVLTVQENTGHMVDSESFDATIEWFVRWVEP